MSGLPTSLIPLSPRLNQAAMKKRQPRLLFADLEAFVDAEYGPDDELDSISIGTPRTQTDGRIARLIGVSRTTVYRWRKAKRVPFDSADAAAIRLGVNPLVIWPTFLYGTLHPCGTLGAAHRHMRRKEPVCAPCRQALTEYARPYQQAWAARQPLRPAQKVGRKPGPQKAPEDLLPCGTPGARERHRRLGEPVCDPCRLATNAYNRQRRAIRREAARNPLASVAAIPYDASR